MTRSGGASTINVTAAPNPPINVNLLYDGLNAIQEQVPSTGSDPSELSDAADSLMSN